MNPYSALRRSLLLQIVGLAACDTKGEPEHPDASIPVDTDVEGLDTDDLPQDTSAAPDTDVVDTDTGGALGGPGGGPGGPGGGPGTIHTGDTAADTTECVGVTQAGQLPVGSAGDTGRMLSCSLTITTRQDCLTNCHAACLSDLESQVEGWPQPAQERFTSLVCGPVWVDGACCAAVDVWVLTVGRPLRVGSEPRTASSELRRGWADPMTTLLPPPALREALIEAWTRRALGEHASIASFARVQLELLGLGAPADLIGDAARAMADEIAHARVCFGVASAWAGHHIGPGALDLTGVVSATDAATVLIDTLTEGCVGETIGAAEAAVAASRCADPRLAAILRQMAEEETRHAALAWRTVRWMVETRPELAPLVAPTLARALDALIVSAGEDDRLAAYGVLDRTAHQTLVQRVRDEVVSPIAAALAA